MNKGLMVAAIVGLALLLSQQKAEAAPGEPEPEPEPEPGLAKFYMPPVMESSTQAITILRIAYNRTTYTCLITNWGGASGTHTVIGQSFYNGTLFSTSEKKITLAPGESYEWRIVKDVQAIVRGSCRLTGDWVGDNRSEGWA